MFDAEGSQQPVMRLNFPFFPRWLFGAGLGGQPAETGASGGAAAMSVSDLCEPAASRCWVPLDEAMKERDTPQDFSGTGVYPRGGTSHPPNHLPNKIRW